MTRAEVAKLLRQAAERLRLARDAAPTAEIDAAIAAVAAFDSDPSDANRDAAANKMKLAADAQSGYDDGIAAALAAAAAAIAALAPAGTALAQAIAAAIANGWAEIGTGTFADVAYSIAELDAIDERIVASSGGNFAGAASTVMGAKNMVWCPTERMMMLLAGAGSGYGGNEVYGAFVDTGIFARLTEPSAYPVDISANNHPLPLSGPPATRHAGAMWHNAPTDTVMLIPGPAWFDDSYAHANQWWEFNPSATETRNGIAPREWRRNADTGIVGNGDLLSVAVLPDHRVYVKSFNNFSIFDPSDGSTVSLGTSGGELFNGPMIYDAALDKVWLSVNFTGLMFQAEPDAAPVFTPITARPVFAGSSMGFDAAGRMHHWSGDPQVARYDEGDDQWYAYLHASGPVGTLSWGKFIFLDDEEVFVALINGTDRLRVWKPPAGDGTPFEAVSAQSFIDDADEFDTVVIPPGLYFKCFNVYDKSLTVDCDGALFARPADLNDGGRAAYLIVEAGPDKVVTIDNFTTTFIPHAEQNTAGIHARGKRVLPDPFDPYAYTTGPEVIVRNAYISGSAMGIETGNDIRTDPAYGVIAADGSHIPLTGKLTVEDTMIENLVGAGALAHGIYAGVSLELTVTRTTVRNPVAQGTLVKSRAAAATVDYGVLAGLSGSDSREFEAPLGGIITITNTVLQKGRNTDNADAISVGLEVFENYQNGPYHATAFTFTDNWLIFDRVPASPEPAWQAGANLFGRYINAPPALTVPNYLDDDPPDPVIEGNNIVNLQSWGEYGNHAADNTMYATRAAAGLAAEPALPVIP